MDLMWIKYSTKDKKLKHALFLALGEQAGKLHLLKTQELSPNEINNIRRHLPELRVKPLTGKVAWIRDNIPNGFRSGYRTLPKKKVHVLNRYKPSEV